ncbi:branched-chain amino acid ABC transporter permease [bacterium]|nr:branched-chain amino acid ABC transporter permease [bacterium]
MVYALIALGYTMVYGILGMINFAHGEIYMIGGYAGATFLGLWGGGLSVPIALGLAVLFSILVSSLHGAGLERFAYRPLRNAPALAPLISAIGMSIALQQYVFLTQGTTPKPFPQFFRQDLVAYEAGIKLFGGTLSPLQGLIIIISTLLMIGLSLFVRHSKMGKAMRATAEDRRMAGLVGIDINRVILTTFVIGSALAAVAGVMVSAYISTIFYRDGYLAGLKAFTAAVFGGIGNIPGAMVGGVLLGLIEALGVWATGASDWKDVFSFGVLILVLLFKPRGLLGEVVAEKV